MARLYMQGLYRVLNISKYGSICLNNGWKCFNMPYCPSICLTIVEYCWMSLNMPENAWINCFNYARVLNMRHYLIYLTVLNMSQVLNMWGFWICCDIVITLLLLLLLSAQFAHPGTLQLTISYLLTQVRT